MKQATWKDEYNVGVKKIDFQHKGFLELLNGFAKAVYEEKPEVDDIEKLLDGLISYTQNHFSTEEAILKEYDAENQKAHYRLHTEFIEKVHNFKNDFRSIDLFEIREMSEFLREWLVDHICIEDKKMFSSIKL